MFKCNWIGLVLILLLSPFMSGLSHASEVVNCKTALAYLYNEKGDAAHMPCARAIDQKIIQEYEQRGSGTKALELFKDAVSAIVIWQEKSDLEYVSFDYPDGSLLVLKVDYSKGQSGISIDMNRSRASNNLTFAQFEQQLTFPNHTDVSLNEGAAIAYSGAMERCQNALDSLKSTSGLRALITQRDKQGHPRGVEFERISSQGLANEKIVCTREGTSDDMSIEPIKRLQS